MKALILNGATRGDPYLDSLQGWLEAALKAEAIALRHTPVAGCRGCFNCWDRLPGICVIDDAGREVARRMVHADLLLGLTPVTFGGYSSELKKVLDRMIGNILPFFVLTAGEVHHERRYPYPSRLAAVGVQDEPDAEEAALFRGLVARNALNLHSVAHAAIVLRRGEAAPAALRAMLDEVGVPR